MNSGSKTENTLKRIKPMFQPVSTDFYISRRIHSMAYGRNEDHSLFVYVQYAFKPPAKLQD